MYVGIGLSCTFGFAYAKKICSYDAIQIAKTRFRRLAYAGAQLIAQLICAFFNEFKMLYFHDTAHMTKNYKLTNIMALYNVSAVLQII